MADARARGERGAVTIMVALWLPLFALMMTFSVDVGHWFDYKRSLQARADATALAAGTAYGGVCFVSGGPTSAGLDSIGHVGQSYTGADATSDLPYLYSSVTPTPYYNVPNLTKGSLSKYHVLFNSKQFWNEPGHANFNMTPAGNFCNSTDEKGRKGAMFDVKLTQEKLGLFFPLPFSVVPAINAHARVELQPEGEEIVVRPMAVRDSNSTPCVSVDFVNADDGTVIKTIALQKDASLTPLNAPQVWDNFVGGGPGDSVSIPAGHNVFVRAFLNNCLGNGDYYEPNSGILYINSYDTTPPTITQGPKITGGVGVINNTPACAPDPYFSTNVSTCNVHVVAEISHQSGIGNNDVSFTVTDIGLPVPPPPDPLKHQGGPTSTTWESDDFPVDQDGQHLFKIDWSQTAGTVGVQVCGDGKTVGGITHPPPCTGTFGSAASNNVVQEAFGACNGCDAPDDSGPIVRAQLGEGASILTNYLTAGPHTLKVRVDVQGLQNSDPTKPAIVLRFATNTNHQTGLINCGQGNGASADQTAITNGCPLIGSPDCKDPNYCAPYKINDRTPVPVCAPPSRSIDPTNPADCVQTTGGLRRNAIPGAVASRIVDPVTGYCSGNNFRLAGGIPANDPRAFTMIVTAPADLSGLTGPVEAPIRNFATFYVTGWDSNANPKCTTLDPTGTGTLNDAFPGSTKKHTNADNGAIWGYWITYTDPNGVGNGQICDPTQISLGNCVAVLTR
jgi:hypothetical protein